jgi:hypothetical protein
LSDIIDGRVSLQEFKGFAACGGFSFGDVLGAGEGWAKSILFNGRARDQFESFFQRDDSFALGVCNGCQMMSNLKEIIPGAERWPHFVRNRSEQYEARFTMVEVLDSPSLFFAGMAGSRMPIAVAHGEGYAEFAGIASARNIWSPCASSTITGVSPNTIRKIPMVRCAALPGSLQPTDALLFSCHIRSGYFGPCSAPGIPVSGAKTVRGFACSVMRAGG